MKNRVTRLSPSDYKIMPWKNGAGSTTELLIAPNGANVQSAFDWRISLAQVPASGPFSAFPDYQRTIVLLEGDPMHLVHQGQGRHELKRLQPYAFHGAWSTEGILTGRPVEDFNAMVREGYGKMRVDVQKGSENPDFSLHHDDLCFIYSYRGSILVALQNENIKLTEQESLLTEQGGNIKIRAGSETSIAVIVSLTRAQT